MPQIRIEVSEETAAALDELATLCREADQRRQGATTHGPLTRASLLAMLAEDAAQIIERSGSWEAANMRQVLQSHGYMS